MSNGTPQKHAGVFGFLKRVLISDFEVAEPLVVPTAGFEDLDLDSIDAVDLAIAVEEEFGVKFTTEDMEGFRCIQDVVDLVLGATSQQPE